MGTRRIIAAAASTALLFALVGCSTGGDESATDDTSSGSSESTETETEESSPGAAPEFVKDAPAGSPVMTLSKAGFSPTTLTISSGDTVVFTTEGGIYGLIVAGLDGKTVTKGLDEYYKFTEKGSYPVEEDISGAEATIVVK